MDKENKMTRIAKRIKEEVISIIPAVIYFAIVFNIIYFAYGLTLKPGAIRYFNHWTITLGALIVGKVMLIANNFPWINAFPNKPLIYNIVWKFFIYGSFVILFWTSENFVEHWYQTDSAVIAYDKLEFAVKNGLFWSNLILLLMVFLYFIVFSELVAAIGKDKVKKMMWG